MKTKRNIAAVISAPREVGDNIPNMANTKISKMIANIYQCFALQKRRLKYEWGLPLVKSFRDNDN